MFNHENTSNCHTEGAQYYLPVGLNHLGSFTSAEVPAAPADDCLNVPPTRCGLAASVPCAADVVLVDSLRSAF